MANPFLNIKNNNTNEDDNKQKEGGSKRKRAQLDSNDDGKYIKSKKPKLDESSFLTTKKEGYGEKYIDQFLAPFLTVGSVANIVSHFGCDVTTEKGSKCA